MLSFTWPWLLALLPLPWLYRHLRRPAPPSGAALKTCLFAHMGTAVAAASDSLNYRRQFVFALLCLVWIGALIAASRPAWVGEPVAIQASGRDLLVAVDISESMKVEDMRVGDSLVDRLSVVKAVVGDFVERRKGDRLGLILFGTQAYLQTPLTFDLTTLNSLLQEARIGFAGGSTAIGDAIGLAVKRLQDRPESDRVLVLLSDGADTASVVEPLQAAKLAAAKGIRIYTIGIGSDEILQQGLFGLRRFNPSSDLDEKTLVTIAETTGGYYFRGRNPKELQEIYGLIDQLEPVQQDAETLRPTRALFHWPLSVALLASMLLMVLHQRGGLRQ